MRYWRFERLAGGLAAVAALALLGLLGGCGNEKRDFREKRFNPLVKRLGEERATLAAVLRAARPGRVADARALREHVAGVEGVTRRITALDPPEGTERRFRRYVRANAAFVAALRRFVDVFAADASQRRQREMAARVQLALSAANDAQTEFQRRLK